jgi:hypothetical protein
MDGAWGDCDNDVDLRSGEIGGQGGKTIEVTIREAILNLTFRPSTYPSSPIAWRKDACPVFGDGDG